MARVRSVGVGRLGDRVTARLRESGRSDRTILLFVAAAIAVNLVLRISAVVYFSLGDVGAYRVATSIGALVGSALDVVFLLIVWMLLHTLRRVERESRRLQTFMDTVYRRLP